MNDQHDAMLKMENKSREFVAAIQEDVEAVRPVYDYAVRQRELAETEGSIRALKHAINTFNLSQEVPGFGMTIDQMLVYIPQLTARKKKLDAMRGRLPKERVKETFGRGTSIIEYDYANYDIAAVEADYVKTVDELSAVQNALDQVNSTVLFEVAL